MFFQARRIVSCTRSSAYVTLWVSDSADARRLGSAASMAARTSGLGVIGCFSGACGPGRRPDQGCAPAAVREEAPSAWFLRERRFGSWPCGPSWVGVGRDGPGLSGMGLIAARVLDEGGSAERAQDGPARPSQGGGT